MNQRIKELAEEAKGFVDLNQHVGGEKGCMVYTYDGLEKFAGLIVAECMEVFSKDLPEPGDGRMLEVINRVCNVAEHFGVEQ